MTPPDDRIRIRHLRDAVEKTLRYTKDSSRQGLENDEILRLAVTNLFEIVVSDIHSDVDIEVDAVDLEHR